jgi:hypothetical protein
VAAVTADDDVPVVVQAHDVGSVAKGDSQGRTSEDRLHLDADISRDQDAVAAEKPAPEEGKWCQ